MTDGSETPHRPAAAGAGTSNWRDVYVTVQDGLRIHARDYGHVSADLPVVCLPGLTRNARDFHELASFLSTRRQRPRRVLAIEFRGRGQSEYDRDWRNYTPATELADVLDVMTACRIDEACFIGTSRGGLVTMLLAAARPTALRAAVLNDIGPVVETAGLRRIWQLHSETGSPESWDQATEFLRRAYAPLFPHLDAEAWAVFARKIFVERDGKPVPDYDPNLLKTLDNIDFDQPLPAIWPQFDGLASIPLMVLRADRSDILTGETLAKMTERRSETDVITVEGAGHAPMLIEPEIHERIAAFLDAADVERV